MRKLSQLFIILVLAISSCKEAKVTNNNSAAVNTLKGNIENYNAGDAQLNIMGFFVDPIFSGDMNESGNFELKLPDDFVNVSQKAFNDYNTSPDVEFQLGPITIQDLFMSLENIDIKGENTKLALAGKYYGFEIFNNDMKIGSLYPCSSLDFMKSYIEANTPIEKGYFYMMVYSDGDVEITGKNAFPISMSYDGDVIEESVGSYDVNIKKGWNLIKHSIESLATDDNGDIQIKDYSYKSVNMNEEKIEWHFFSS